MVKIIALRFSMLPNAAHFTFFTKLDAQIEASSAVRAALTVQMTMFDPLLESERQNMDWVKKSEYTSLIKAADKRVDAALCGLKAQTVAAQHSLQPEIAATANRMLILLNNYGDVAKKPYQQEIGDVQALLDNLTGSYSADARITGNDVWVTELQTALTEFNTLYATRNEQVTLKPAKNFRTTRREIEVVYHQMTSIIESNVSGCIDYVELTFPKCRFSFFYTALGMVLCENSTQMTRIIMICA